MKINDCMCKDVCFVKPDCKVYDAARIMCENHIGCIPVCNDEKGILGIITDRDILLRTVACNKDTKITTVGDIMSTDVCTCGCEDDVIKAENVMAKFQIRRIPVVDSDNKVIGIITMGDLAKYDKELGQDNVCTTIENICSCKGNVKNCD